MESITNNKLKRKIVNKGILLDQKKKHQFDRYSYYQVINAYKSIFYSGIETIEEIQTNILNDNFLDRYRKTFEIEDNLDKNLVFRAILIKICKKYGISLKNNESETILIEKIKKIKYYNHLYPSNVIYSDFVRMYKFEHGLRNLLLKYVLIIEEGLKNIFTSYLNDVNAKDTFLTDINNYETGYKSTVYAIDSIKLVLTKQTNKYSNPIKRKNMQDISFPYWIIINELTLGETIKIISNLKDEHRNIIFEKCVNYFTRMELNYFACNSKEKKEKYFCQINSMREILRLIGIFRNNLAHNQPIYNFNIKEYYSTNHLEINRDFPKSDTKAEQYILNSKYMSYLANFFGSDRYNSRTQNVEINLSWIVYVIYKMISHLDGNSNFYNELIYSYSKYNILIRPTKISINNYSLYEDLLSQIENFVEHDFGVENIIQKIDNKEKHKQLIISLNKKIKATKNEMNKLLEKNKKNNECNKYNQFPFEKRYSIYTGIDKKFFEKIK